VPPNLAGKIKRRLAALFGSSRDSASGEEKLRNVPSQSCDTSSLSTLSPRDLRGLIESEEASRIWSVVRPQVDALRLPEMTGGVNTGDQRAIFSLIYGLRAKSVLEIGTHIGCSTLHIALALKQLGIAEGVTLQTVDIRDVNDARTKPWKEYRSPAAPAELLRSVHCDGFTRFHISPSLEFFSNSGERFDFIFLDGLHDAHMVYQEIPAAMSHLNEGGHVLLHDYFPDLAPLWGSQPAIPGPFLAVQRLLEEGANLEVLPLGELPWRTKLDSRVTSLAVVAAAS